MGEEERIICAGLENGESEFDQSLRPRVLEEYIGQTKVKEYQKAGMQNVTLQLYEGARHECLSENVRDTVIQNMLKWMEKVSE